MHISSIPKSRRGGSHALDLAAYRRGTRYDVPKTRFASRARRTADHRDRTDVSFSNIITPQGVHVPDWVRKPQDLWTEADRAETRQNSRIAREWIIWLPRDLNRRAANRLAKSLARLIADRFGCVCDLSVHIAPGTDVSSGTAYKPHAHILSTTRKIGSDGFGSKTTIELSDKDLRKRGLARGSVQIDQVRAQIAEMTNIALSSAGKRRRVSHLSYRRRGLPLYGRGGPKRYGITPRLSIRQKCCLRYGAARQWWRIFGTDAERQAANAKIIRDQPTVYRRIVEDTHGSMTSDALRSALQPLVPTDQLDEIVEKVERAAHGAAPASPLAASEAAFEEEIGPALSVKEAHTGRASEEVASDEVKVATEDRESPEACDETAEGDGFGPFFWSELPDCLASEEDTARDQLRRKKAKRESTELLRDWRERVQSPMLADLDCILNRMRATLPPGLGRETSWLDCEEADRDVYGEVEPRPR